MPQPKKPRSKCAYCNKEVKRHNSIYCNNKCQNNYQYTSYIHEWKSGNNTGVRGEYQTSSHIRRYLFEKYLHKCCRCGWNKQHPLDGKIPLEIDHVDGNYKNNNEDNLKLLCPNCHSLTPTYKSRNKNGRKARKKYKK